MTTQQTGLGAPSAVSANSSASTSIIPASSTAPAFQVAQQSGSYLFTMLTLLANHITDATLALINALWPMRGAFD